MQRPLSAGDTVESQCTRCKSLLNHTIIAMVHGEVVRVKCNTCGSEHNHRPVKPARAAAPATTAPRSAAGTRSSAGPKTSRAKVAAPSNEEIWEEAIRPHDPDQAIAYSMEGKYKANTLVAHPSFGIGVVAAATSGKIDVVFKCGRKLLRTQ